VQEYDRRAGLVSMHSEHTEDEGPWVVRFDHRLGPVRRGQAESGESQLLPTTRARSQEAISHSAGSITGGDQPQRGLDHRRRSAARRVMVVGWSGCMECRSCEWRRMCEGRVRCGDEVWREVWIEV
jgi:hypothetical protein